MLRLLLLTALTGLTSGCIRSVDEIVPVEGTSITGQATAKDLQSGDFLGRVDVTVNARGTSVHTTSDDRGFFRLDRLPVGTYDVLLEAVGNPPRSRLLNAVRLVVDGQSVDLGEVRLGAPGGFQGEVLLRDGDDVLTPPGVLVQVVGTALAGFTDDQGRYRVSGIPEGEYDLVASFPGFLPSAVDGVPVVSNLSVAVRELVLNATNVATPIDVAGRVELQGAPSSEGVRVTFVDANQEIEAPLTGPDGAYALTVNAGVYRVRFSRDGYQSVEIPGVAVLEALTLGLRTAILVPAPPGDRDGDGVADEADDDRDNDGVPNDRDVDPDDPTRGADRDGDGVPDQLDADNDNDGLDDPEEVSPGRDGFITDPYDPDTDDDGVPDGVDVCPTVPNPEQSPDACPRTQAVPCDRTPPDILRMSPNPVRAGGRVVVTGLPLVAPACLGLGPLPAVLHFPTANGTVTSTPSSDIVDDFALGVAAQKAEYPVPVTAVTGEVTLRQDYASEVGLGRVLQVEPAGLRVFNVLPAAMVPGRSVTVVGRGFRPGPGTELQVTFPDGSRVDVAPELDDRFEVEVPPEATAAEGRLTVTLGTESSTVAFEISSGVPVVFDIETPMVQPGPGGTGLRLLGVNLDQVDAFVATGGVTLVPALVEPDLVEIPTVPEGVRPGPITLRRAGEPDLVTCESLSVVTARQGTVNHVADRAIYRLNGAGVPQVLVFLTSGGRVRVLRDDATFTQINEVAVLGPNEFPLAVTPRPRHDVAVVATSAGGLSGETHIVDLEIPARIATCRPNVPGRQGMIVSFSEDQRYFYATADFSNDGARELLRVDLDRMSCSVISQTAVCPNQNLGLYGVAGLRDSVFFGSYFVGAVVRYARYRVLATNPPTLDCDAFPDPPGMVNRPFQGLVWNAPKQQLWGYSTGNQGGGEVVRVSPDVTDTTIDARLLVGGPFMASPGGRWMMGPISVVDLELDEIAWRNPIYSPSPIDVHPNGRSFIRMENRRVRVYDIEAGPLPTCSP